eukprot:SAG31_NODE_1690_length_7524_cov_2.991919_4_plen_131_part_00
MYSAALQDLLEAHARQRSQKRLFLYIAPNNVHTPLGAPERYMAEFSTMASKGRALFSATATAMDAFLSNVTGLMDRHGLLGNATIVFTTDNGGNLRGNGNNWPLRGTQCLAHSIKPTHAVIHELPIKWTA